MRLKGSFTVEGAYIFPFFIILVCELLILNFTVHDGLLESAVRVLGAFRYEEAKNFYYNAEDEEIDLEAIVKSPVIGDDDDFLESQEKQIKEDMDIYYRNKKLGRDDEPGSSEIASILDMKSNAAQLRAGGRAVQLIGG